MLERRQRARLASAGILAVVFASGAIVGVAVQRSVDASTTLAEVGPAVEQGERRSEDPASGPDRERVPRRPLYEMVGMASEQLQVADSLVRLHRSTARVLEQDFRRDMDSIFVASGRQQQFRQDSQSLLMQLRADIRGLMTHEQVIMYDSLLAADDARRQAEEERRRAEREQRSGNRPD